MLKFAVVKKPLSEVEGPHEYKKHVKEARKGQ